ncbi:hypothetical protein [Dyella choica]|uniref:DUF305 domain-containing protein n=1 Tax=Dyella choica TaxID=1927959 RepID=A0A432M3N8_9GAMM|nr:hypothetical protein [Dyella choica]RUL73601.1 hypothetical protein EKH80_14870 [Dyella choica]
MKIGDLLFVLASASLATVGFAQATPATHEMAMTTQSAPAPAPKLQAAMRELWHGHVVSTRNYALAVHAHDSAKAKVAADAVVANAKQIAAAVGSFYGKAAGDQTLQLLAGHWGGVKALTDASAAGDSAGEQKAMADLSSNVTAIAKFFSSANPNLPESALQSLFATHMAHHATQIRQIMGGDSKGEQITWTEMQAHMNTIADAFAGGIAKQFPDKAH